MLLTSEAVDEWLLRIVYLHFKENLITAYPEVISNSN